MTLSGDKFNRSFWSCLENVEWGVDQIFKILFDKPKAKSQSIIQAQAKSKKGKGWFGLILNTMVSCRLSWLLVVKGAKTMRVFLQSPAWSYLKEEEYGDISKIIYLLLSVAAEPSNWITQSSCSVILKPFMKFSSLHFFNILFFKEA